MKKLNRLFPIMMVVAALVVGGKAAAADDSALELVVTPYAAGQQLDFFFEHSIHALKFIEDGTETPVAISIVTQAQKTEYEKAGYAPKVADAVLGDLEQYSVLFRRDGADVAPMNIGLTDKLRAAGVEMIYPVGNRRVLVKFAKTSSLGQVALKDAQFAELKGQIIHGDAIPPEGRTAFKPPAVAGTTQGDPRWLREIAILAGALLVLILIQVMGQRQNKQSPGDIQRGSRKQ